MNREIPWIMRSKLENFALTILVFLNSPFLVCSQPQIATMPRDAELREIFRSHRDAFEKLAAMGIEDTGIVSLLSPEMLNERPLTDGRETLSPKRRSEYTRLLANIKPDLVMGIDVYRITFSYSRGGSALSIGPGWMKGIAYLPQGHERVGMLVTNLDKPPGQNDVYIVPIESKWYIIYVQFD
jgi:hypothetical protein